MAHPHTDTHHLAADIITLARYTARLERLLDRIACEQPQYADEIAELLDCPAQHEAARIWPRVYPHGRGQPGPVAMDARERARVQGGR